MGGGRRADAPSYRINGLCEFVLHFTVLFATQALFETFGYIFLRSHQRLSRDEFLLSHSAKAWIDNWYAGLQLASFLCYLGLVFPFIGQGEWTRFYFFPSFIAAIYMPKSIVAVISSVRIQVAHSTRDRRSRQYVLGNRIRIIGVMELAIGMLLMASHSTLRLYGY